MMKIEAKKILQGKDLTIEIQHVECKNKSDTSNNRGNSKSFRILLEQQTGKA